MMRFYTCNDDDEDIRHTDPDEAIEEYLDNCDDDPETVTVYAFEPYEVDIDVDPEGVAEYVLEKFTEELGAPFERKEDRPSPSMIQAAEEFVETIRAEYVPWRCEEVFSERRVVNVAEWRKNAWRESK